MDEVMPPADAALLWLLDAFRAMRPVKNVIQEMRTRHADNGEWMTPVFQDAVVRVVVRDPVVEKYAPLQSYMYRFLKSYTDAIETMNRELSDDLVAELVEFVARGRVLALSAVNADEMHHVTYRIPAATADQPEDVTVTCRVASVFNEVGLKIWEAGWYLAEYVLAHRELFAGRSVLELGAGVGITGIVVAKCVPLSRLVMSDYAPKVMLNLRYNTEINAQDVPFVCPVEVEAIDWETWDPEQARATKAYIRPDILLAGDCVYDVDAFPPLVRVLQTFLGDDEYTQPNGEADRDATSRRFAVFAATIRNQVTFQTFLDILAKVEITYEDITSESLQKMSATPMFPYDNRSQIRLCKLYRTMQHQPQKNLKYF